MEEGKRRILIVDDNPEFTKPLEGFLELVGLQVSIARDGHTALSKLLCDPPEIVLLDLKLPDISGMEVLKSIKEIEADVGVIVITGHGGEQAGVDFMEAGALEFQSKPIDYGVLRGKINRTLKTRDAEARDRQFKRYSSQEPFFPFLARKIRDPLQAIIGALGLIQTHSHPKDGFFDQSIRIIEQEIGYLDDFVQGCLDFIHPPTERLFEEIDVNELISFALEKVSHMVDSLCPKISITTRLDPQLPKVRGKYDEIKRAMVNLLRNGFEAMPEGGTFTLTTGFLSDPPPGWVEIVFADTGTGIKKDDMRNLFIPFFTTKTRGSGLGLVICKRIIMEGHRGTIQIVSEEGKGTSVTVRLPVTLPSNLA